MRIQQAFQQISYLAADLSALVNHRHQRWLTMWLWYGSAPGIVTYRLNRIGLLLFGKGYRVLRVLFWPFFLIMRLIGPVLEISYHADIGPGLRIPHPSLGVMVSGYARCGPGLVLTGGNWIALRDQDVHGEILVGDNTVLRANAVILGPVEIGCGSIIGAGAVCLSDCPSGSTMVGVPARPVAIVSTDQTVAGRSLLHPQKEENE